MITTSQAGAGALLIAIASISPGLANPVPVTWTSFMHAAPADRAAVIDEVDSGTVVDVQSCESGWCRVVANRAVGYLPQAVLFPPTPTSAAAPGEQSCFASEKFTRHGEGPVFFCPRR